MAGKKGQRTINIYAFFFSLVAFLFVMQLGTGIAGALMGFRYPDGLLGMTGVVNTISLIIVLTAIFLAASSAGFIIIRKAEADKKNFIIYHCIVIAVMALSAIYVIGAYKNVWWILLILAGVIIIPLVIGKVKKTKWEVVMHEQSKIRKHNG